MEKTKLPSVVTLVTHVEHGEQLTVAVLSGWLVKLLMAGVRFPGFWSGEIVPPFRNESKSWALLQRFRTEEQAEAFRTSPTRQTLLAQLKEISVSDKTRASDEIAANASIGSAVTAIVTNVKAEMEEDYWAWGQRIHSAQANFPGYGGVYVQPPAPGKAGQWTTLVRFDSPQALENWLESPVRQELLREASKFVDVTRYHPVTSSFPGFFPQEEEGGRATPKWKASLLVILGLFPLLEVLRYFYTPWASSVNIRLVLALAFSTVVSVSMVSYVTMPLLVKLFSWWFAPPPDRDNRANDFKGLAIVISIFALEVLAAWNVLVK
ncbi:hypothetical protein BH11CYA1_BH11CYA1_13840 [soil metagenome]